MHADAQTTKPEMVVSEPDTSRRPRVSVVIPLYNKVKNIGATLSSVFAQTVTDFEVVVVDDGSTDGSGDIVRGFDDARLRLIEQANAGESGARNRGIAEARCDLIALIDADDFWFPHFLKTVLALHDRFPDAGAYATAFIGIQNGTVIRFPYVGVSHLFEGELINDYFRSCTLGASIVCSSSVMIPKSVFARVGNFLMGVRNGADLHMWARIALEYPIAWSTVESAMWNLDAENRIAGRIVMSDAPFAKILEDAVAQGRVANERAKWVTAYLARFRIHYATVSIEHGDRRQARRLLWLGRKAQGRRRDWWISAIRACIPRQLLQLRYLFLARIPHH
jgi:glycosyltransferase involved in cell wall biosynthesis